MTIRSIFPTETDAFLSLLCEVFGLDIAAARHVFYNEPFFDLKRKWALFDQGEMVTILTTTPLQFGWGRAIGIAGVATKSSHRGRGYAQLLLEETLRYSQSSGEGAALLFANQEGVYSRSGFEPLDRVIRGSLEVEERRHGKTLRQERVQKLYNEWAEKSPNRLRRDRLRWTNWNWTLKTCESINGGYLCQEAMQIREAILPEMASWPVPRGAEWFGLESMTQEIKPPITNPRQELLLMARGFNAPPQMFMSDQF